MAFLNLDTLPPLNTTFIPFERNKPAWILKETLDSQATSPLLTGPLVDCFSNELQRFKNKVSFQYVDIAFKYCFDKQESRIQHCNMKLDVKRKKHIWRAVSRVISHLSHNSRNCVVGLSDEIIQVNTAILRQASIKLISVTMYRLYKKKVYNSSTKMDGLIVYLQNKMNFIIMCLGSSKSLR